MIRASIERAPPPRAYAERDGGSVSGSDDSVSTDADPFDAEARVANAAAERRRRSTEGAGGGGGGGDGGGGGGYALDANDE